MYQPYPVNPGNLNPVGSSGQPSPGQVARTTLTRSGHPQPSPKQMSDNSPIVSSRWRNLSSFSLSPSLLVLLSSDLCLRVDALAQRWVSLLYRSEHMYTSPTFLTDQRLEARTWTAQYCYLSMRSKENYWPIGDLEQKRLDDSRFTLENTVQ